MSVVRYEDRGEVGVLHFDDGKANVISPASLEDLNAALDRAERDAKAVVLIGRAGRFCAGFDLSVLRQGAPGGGALVRGGAALLARLYAFPLPVVLACTGHALGMGALVLLAADTRIGAAVDSKIALNEVSIGLTLPGFGIALAEARLSRRHLQRAMVLAEFYSPTTAVDAGFLDRTCPPEALLEEAANEAKGLAALDGKAHAATKRAHRGPTLERILAHT